MQSITFTSISSSSVRPESSNLDHYYKLTVTIFEQWYLYTCLLISFFNQNSYIAALCKFLIHSQFDMCLINHKKKRKTNNNRNTDLSVVYLAVRITKIAQCSFARVERKPSYLKTVFHCLFQMLSQKKTFPQHQRFPRLSVLKRDWQRECVCS